MSKPNSDADVLTNKINLGLARHQNLLASWVGMQAATTPSKDATENEQEDGDLKQESFGHDRLGVGGILPKDIADGSFTRKTLTSNDKLLEQLIGKKRAKAHMATQLQASRPNASQPNIFGKANNNAKKEDSEDEDEGRTAAFKSKRRRVAQKPVAAVQAQESDSEGMSKNHTTEAQADEKDAKANDSAINACDQDIVKNEEPQNVASRSIPRRTKAKPTSFLDELLAKKSEKKKNKKAKHNTQADT